MNRKILSLISTTCIFASVAFCKNVSDEVQNIVNSNNKFAVNFYNELAKTGNNNLFFSPFSIIDAFAMAYEGATGKTANEIKSTLFLPAKDNQRLSGFQLLHNQINQKKSDCILSIANAYWVQHNFVLKKKYLETIEKFYQSEAYNLDFKMNSQQAVDRINNWAEEKTKGKIKKFLNYGDVDSGTRLVLTNAIYFKALWQIQFNKNLTEPADFRVKENKTIKVQMMHLQNAEFPYAETEDFQLLKIPYGCNNLSILIILPRTLNEEMVRKIDYEKIMEIQKNLSKQKIDISIPKVKIEQTYDLINPLRNLGIKTAFDPFAADFSKITGSRDLYISKAVQKSFIEINEEGTEAAAATGIVMNITAARPGVKKVFVADHPFIFFIIEEESNLILFMGRTVRP